MGEILAGTVACFLSFTMPSCTIPVPKTASIKSGVQRPLTSRRMENGDCVTIRQPFCLDVISLVLLA